MIFTVTVLFLTVGCEGVPRERTGLDSYYPALDGATEAERDYQQPSDRVLARIGDDTITESELRDRILDRYYGARALNGLVRESLFISEAGSLGLSIEAEEVVARVEQEMDQILGRSFDERRVSRLRLEEQGLLESDLRREIVLEVGPALLIQKVISAHRQIEEEQILDLWRASWKEPRRLIEHIAFPMGDADSEERQIIERWAQQTVKVLELGTPLQNAVEKPVGLRSSFTPKVGGGWIRESDLAGSPIFFEVFQVEVGEVLGPIHEDNFGWHLFRVVETRSTRSYSEVREELLQELRNQPATDAEILAVEQRIRRRIPVYIETNPFPSKVKRPEGDR